MDTSYSSDDQSHQSDVAIKHEPVEDMMAGEYPVDMSVSQRDAINDTINNNRGGPLPPHHYMPVSVENMNLNRAYFTNLYSNANFPFPPQDPLNPQRFHAQRQAQPPVPHRPVVSPPSQRPQLPHPPPQQQQQPPLHQARSAAKATAGSRAAANDDAGQLPTFKIKDSKGKLAVLDIIGPDSSSHASIADFMPVNGHQRAKREFVPESKKDDGYWCKRIKNNDSARRSRVKRKALEKLMESRLMELQKENIELRHEMDSLRRQLGLPEKPKNDIAMNFEGDCPVGLDNGKAMMANANANANANNARDEELERQSAGSDDSQNNDDSRAYNIGSMSALSHSLGPTRDRADSFGSGSSGGRSSRPESRNSPSGDVTMRTDKTGALDLSHDVSNRFAVGGESSSSPPMSFTTQTSKLNLNSNDMEVDDKKLGQDLKGFPLKCRWKREMQSGVHTSSLPSVE